MNKPLYFISINQYDRGKSAWPHFNTQRQIKQNDTEKRGALNV